MTRGDLIGRCVVVLILGVGVIATTGGVLSGIDRWGHYDWDYYFFQNYSHHRSFFEFGELPLWNPWYMGGVPSVGNYQSNFPNPWFLLNLAVGPVVAIKLMIVIHQLIGVASMFWMARVFGMSRLAAVYTSGIFFFSSWLALRIHSGHLTYLCTAYLPLLVGLLARARTGFRLVRVIAAGAIVALMILQGGIYDVIFAGSVLGPLTIVWSLQDRSARPLVTALLVGVAALGLSAVKLIPVLAYMREYPRETGVGVSVWQRNQETLEASMMNPLVTDRPSRPIAPTIAQTITELQILVTAIFLGRDRVSNQIYHHAYPVQDYGWHEFGAYVGPVWLMLVAVAPLVGFRRSWPWLLIAGGCFLLCAGNIHDYAPWCLIHRLPIFRSMHCPSRFMMPCVFAASVAAGFALDALRLRFASIHPKRYEIVFGLVIVASLLDSVMVFRHAIQDAFPDPPPPRQTPSPEIVTIKGEFANMTIPMLANQCTAQGYEPLKPDVWVKTLGAPDYRGEVSFRPDLPATPPASCSLVGWTPNTVSVQVTCPSAGTLVLNRNWNAGWRADPPYQVLRFEGLIAAHLEPGEHRIRFVFVPRDFWLGFWISLASIVVCGASLVRWGRARGGSIAPVS